MTSPGWHSLATLWLLPCSWPWHLPLLAWQGRTPPVRAAAATHGCWAALQRCARAGTKAGSPCCFGNTRLAPHLPRGSAGFSLQHCKASGQALRCCWGRGSCATFPSGTSLGRCCQVFSGLCTSLPACLLGPGWKPLISEPRSPKCQQLHIGLGARSLRFSQLSVQTAI